MQLLTKRNLLLIAGIVIGGVLLLGIVSVLNGRNKVKVTILASPMDSKLTLDGKHIRPGEKSIKKGRHTLTAKRDHFDEETVQFDTAALGPTKTVGIILNANDEAGRKYLLDNQEEQMLREKISGNEFTDQTAALLKRYPFTAHLPYEVPKFKVDYAVQKDKSVVFTITLHIYGDAPNTPGYDSQAEQAKQAALDFLKKQGADVGSLKIHYAEDGKPPLVSELPFIDLTWRVDAVPSQKYPNNPNVIALSVKYWSTQGKQDALDWIRFKGYDTDKIEIIYVDALSSSNNNSGPAEHLE